MRRARSPVPLLDMASIQHDDKDQLVDDAEPRTRWYTFTSQGQYDGSGTGRGRQGSLPGPLQRSTDSSALKPPRRVLPGPPRTSLSPPSLSSMSTTTDTLNKRFAARSLSPSAISDTIPPIRNRAGSDEYFGEQSVYTGASRSALGQTLSTPHNVEVRGYNLKQSARLPYWIWFCVAKSLGIKLRPGDKPVLGTLLFIVSLLFTLVNVFATLWYLVYDVVNEKTRQTVLTGSTLALLTIYWCSMCIYANKLAFRLLTNTKMLMSVRMHSKTIFKINTVFLLSALALAFCVLNNYQNSSEFSAETCSGLYLPPVICKLKYVSRVGVTILGLIWNLLVGNVVLSVCRTHTIGIRRFIREMENDGLLYVQYCRDLHDGHGRFDDVMHNFETEELPYENEDADVHDETLGESWVLSSRRQSRPSLGWNRPLPAHVTSSPRHVTSQRGVTSHGEAVTSQRARGSSASRGSGDGGEAIQEDPSLTASSSAAPEVPPAQELQTIVSPSVVVLETEGAVKDSEESPVLEKGDVAADDTGEADDLEDGPEVPNLFSTEDILLSYHQIMVRLRTTSRSLQRWMASWIALITLWSILYVIYWINHPATFIGIAEFVIPLLVLPLICSAYAEVNFEGKRLLKCICPLEDRVWMLIWMSDAPLQMTVYDTAISFSSIVTVIAAVGLAFLTRIMLSELDIGG